MTDRLLAVTGATGTIGSRAVRGLAAAGVRPRLLLPDPALAPNGVATEFAVVPSYRNSAAVRTALTGVDTLFLVSARESADRMDEQIGVVDAAAEAGVRRVVYLSLLAAAADATFTFGRDHWFTEQRIRAYDLEFCFLRPSLYQAAVAGFAGPDGVIRGPAAGGAVSAVSHHDVAAVATAVLLEDERHDGITYDVTGPDALSLDQVAEQLAQATGLRYRYQPQTVEQAFAARAGLAATPYEVTGWVSSYQAIANGELATVSDAVERVTGRPAQSFAAWLAEHPPNR
jgi:NAD(P)H dehydrogenase (quinone)